MRIIEKSETESTNDDLMALARLGHKHGTVVVAKTQTAGKGTKGRSFYSAENGIYMSVLLRDFDRSIAEQITRIVAVACHDAIFSVCGAETKIKPVNDLFFGGKKVCGILTQASSTGAMIDFVVVGVGINLFEPKGGFPDELSDIAGCILPGYDEKLKQSLILAAANNILEYTKTSHPGPLLERYNSLLASPSDLGQTYQ